MHDALVRALTFKCTLKHINVRDCCYKVSAAALWLVHSMITATGMTDGSKSYSIPHDSKIKSSSRKHAAAAT
jgi:hypothetical protein